MNKFLYLIATDQIRGGAVGIVKVVLWILSGIYGVIGSLRKYFYKIKILRWYHLPQPVISVGNITVGGAGKTPLVEYIARELKKRNVRPVILTRGYMGEGKAAGKQDSDEARMLKDKLPDVPVLVGADRVNNAKVFLTQNKADVFLLDDGFQHLRLARDLDIVVIDATNPWGNGCLLPRGLLREPRSALSRSQMFVLTKTDFGEEHVPGIKEELRSINPEACVVDSIHQPVSFVDLRSKNALELTAVLGQKICAVSSIGSPDSFAQIIKKLGADIVEHFVFMDHYSYTQGDVERVVALCRDRDTSTILITDKDAVKLKSYLGIIPDQIQILSLKIQIAIVQGEEAFLERIHHIL